MANIKVKNNKISISGVKKWGDTTPLLIEIAYLREDALAQRYSTTMINKYERMLNIIILIDFYINVSE